MQEKRINDESSLVNLLKESLAYRDFTERLRPKKIDREREAWSIIASNRGNFTDAILRKAFDIADGVGQEGMGPGGRWFGALLAAPNMNLLFQSSIDEISAWIELLLYSEDQDVKERLNFALSSRKIRGASNGLATLLLYLSNPDHRRWFAAIERRKLRNVAQISSALPMSFRPCILRISKKSVF